MSKFLDYTGLTYLIGKFKKVAFTGSYNDLTDKPTIPPGAVVDSSLSSSSENPVQNQVIYSALQNKADSSHTHNYTTENTVSSIASSIVSSGGYAVDSAVVHISGAETINGVKTFASGLTVSNGATVSGGLSVRSALNMVTGNVVFSKAATVSGSAMTHSCQVTMNDSSLNCGIYDNTNGKWAVGISPEGNAFATAPFTASGGLTVSNGATINSGLTVSGSITGTCTDASSLGGSAASAYAKDADIVHILGAETISGAKTFTSNVKANNDLIVSKSIGLYNNLYIHRTDPTDGTTDRTKPIFAANVGLQGSNGLNIGFGASGNTVIGGGESFVTQINALVSSGGEDLYLVSDSSIILKTNCGTTSGLDAANVITIGKDGIISGSITSLGGVSATNYLRNDVSTQTITASAANVFLDLKTSGGTHDRVMRLAAQPNGRAGLYYNLGSGTTSVGWLINIEPDGTFITKATAANASSLGGIAASNYVTTTVTSAEPTYASGFVDYNAASKVWVYRKGNICQLRGAVKPSVATGTSSFTMFTIPEGYRPLVGINCVQQGTGMNRFLLSVTASGNVSVERYGTTSAISSVNSGTWLNVGCTYICE